MAKFTKRVGQVGIRQRAIAGSLYAHSIIGGVKTASVAAQQGITPERALTVMKYAELKGWVHSVKGKHRGNSFYYRWNGSGRGERVLFDDTVLGEKEEAQAVVSAYFWGHHEAL